MQNPIHMLSKGLTGLGGLLLGGVFASSCVYKVEPGERAIVNNKFQKGISKKVRGEGYHLYIPFMQEIIKYDIRINPFDFKTYTGTKDLQKVDVKIRIFYRPLENFLPKIHLDYNKDYMNRILPSIGNEVLKAIIAQYDAEHLLKNREKVSKEIRDVLTVRAQNFDIVLEDVSLNELQFTSEFMASIEKKQVAQQEAEKYKYVVMQNEEEKNAKIIESEGKAIAAKMISEAVGKYGNALIEYRKIEASKYIAEKLTPTQNVAFIPSNPNLLLNIN